MYTIEQKREFTQGFKIEEGWIIILNILTPADYFEDTWLFEATNLLKGEHIIIYYTNDEIGYSLYYSKLQRKDGQWNSTNENNENVESMSSNDISSILTKVQSILNPTRKEIALLKISGWSISTNNLLDAIDEYSDSEFLFFATKDKFFIDVSFVKNNDTPYKICLGRNKHKLSGINYSVHHPVELKNIELATLNEVIDLIENYTLLTEEYFRKLMKP